MDSAHSTPTLTPPPPEIANLPISGIYKASYSNIPVIEMTVGDVAVMKRQADNSLNATQILKVAGVDKGRRTKILEKEIITGPHEKVQGGYGKYQGTWVPFDIGVEFCKKYGVEDILRPLLEFDVASAGELHSTPTKEEANAAKRKAMYSSNGQRFSQESNYSYTGGTRFGPPLPVPSPTPSQNTQQQPNFLAGQPYPHSGSQRTPDQYEPANKRHRYEEQSNTSMKMEDSQEFQESQSSFSQDFTPVPPLRPHETKNYNLSKDLMINLFLEPDTPNATSTKALIDARATDFEMDVVIDEYGHTALHWASALARITTVEALVRKGANPRRANDAGETPLIRAVLVTNNHDQQSFARLLDSLHFAIPIADNNGRTVLHHIAVTAGVKGRSAAARYYLETLLEFIARGRGSVSLTYFRNHVLDAQDQYGDTALNIAARVGNKGLVESLQELNANAYMPNKFGLRAVDFDIGQQQNSVAPSRLPAPVGPVGQRSKDIIQEMRSVFDSLNDDFNAEIAQKQTFLDEAHAKLKDKTRELTDTRRKIQLLKDQTTAFEDLQKKSKNLEQAIQAEETHFHNETNGNINGDALSFQGPFDADAPMIVKPLPPDGTTGAAPLPPTPLPPAPILRARVTAYKKNNAELMARMEALRYQNKLMEDKIKSVVSKCAGVPLENLDTLLDALLQAVDSDGPSLDQNELVAFLNRIPRGA